MDILQDFKYFLLGEGLKKLIDDFRNPSWLDQLELGAKYLPHLDAREITDDEQVYVAPIARRRIFFISVLQKECDKLIMELLERCEKLVILKQKNIEYINEVLIKSAIDFNLVRRQVREDQDLNRYYTNLQYFILNAETTFINFEREVLASHEQKFDSRKNTTPKTKNLTSFGFKDKPEMLRTIYRELILERGNFIDSERTSEENFISILTAEDVTIPEGCIRFGCESRQVAYILTKLGKRFTNLTFSAIEESQKFYSKRGNLIKADSLSKYLSDEKEVKEKKRIDQFFTSLY